jgi:hypothetical protein
MQPVWSLVLLLALRQESQTSEPDKLKATVATACEGKITVRPQAVKRLLAMGAPVMPHVRDYVRAKGRNALSPGLVEALGKLGDDGRALLLELLDDQRFYWRPQAVRGLLEAGKAEDRPRVRALLLDRAPIVRRAAAEALGKAGDREAAPKLRALLADPDHRVRFGAGHGLLLLGDDGGLPVLVELLRLDLEFFGDPIGVRARSEAFEVLKKTAGQDFGYHPAAEGPAREAAARKCEEWARERLHGEWQLAAAARVLPDAARYVVGVELRTCNLGEMWLRLDDQGQLAVGLENPQRVALDAQQATALRGAFAGVADGDSRIHGAIVCDFERFCGLSSKGTRSLQSAPGSRPKELEPVVAALLAALTAAGRPELMEQARVRLAEFGGAR